MTQLLQILGQKGLVIVVGILTFFLSHKYSVELFNWLENQTLKTKSYILDQLEFLFIEVKSEHITYILLFLSLGLGTLTWILFGLLGFWLIGFILGIAVCFIGLKIPRPLIKQLIQHRIRKYESQMVDGLTLLSGGIRAGLSVPQALSVVVKEMPAPISQEFNLVLQQNKIGVPLDECFENLSTRIPTPDNHMFVSSMNILRETGGNLGEVFDTIVGVIRERIRLKQKIQQYTAAGMFQGLTIAAMPLFMGVLYGTTSPESMKMLFTTPLGLIICLVVLILDALGLFIIMKIVRIKMD